MPFARILGQSRALAVLAAALRADRVSHAYLFEGPDGVGRRLAALALAQGLNCEAASGAGEAAAGVRAAGGCGRCLACRKIEAGQHPDVRVISPGGQAGSGVYLVDQVRALGRDLAFRPFEGRRKVAVLDRAEVLGPVASNALLKTLEEPPPSSHLILLAPGRHHLLPTVASRCQAITFRPLEMADLLRILEAAGVPAAPDGGWDRAAAVQVAALADGRASRAVELAEAGGLESRRALLEQVARLSRRRVDELFQAAEALAADKDALPGHLEALRGWLRDLLVARVAAEERADLPAPLLHADLAEAVAREAAGRSVDELAAGLEAVDAAQAALRRNANRTLVVERLLLTLARP